MSNSNYGRRLDPYRRVREPLAVKGTRTTVVTPNNPTTVDKNQPLTIWFPKLEQDEVIAPGTVKLAYTINLNSTDPDRTVVQNLGRAIVKKITIHAGSVDITTEDSDVIGCYTDMWMTTTERQNAHYQGIDTSEDRNITKLRLGADSGDATVQKDKAVAGAYENRFHIPLDFEFLESHGPYYPQALNSTLGVSLTFNDYKHVIQATGDPNASYKISNINLEFEKVHQPALASLMRGQYARLPIFYERVYRQSLTRVNKKDPGISVDLNIPARSMKGILMLFVEPPAPYARNSEKYYNPKIEKVEVSIHGSGNQLYEHGLHAYQLWEEAQKYFASAANKRNPGAAEITKDLELSSVSCADYLNDKFALWLDLRASDDDQMHGSGRKISGNIAIQITKKVEPSGPLDMYVYLIMDGTLKIQDGRFIEAEFS